MKGTLLVAALLLVLVPIMGGADAALSFCTWKQFNDDYIDTDTDGEKDDYASFDVGEYVSIIDTLEDFETLSSLGMTILTLRSDPDEKIIFGNTLDSTVQKGEMIRVRLHIIQDTEEDGDPCEFYDVDSISVYVDPNKEEPAKRSLADQIAGYTMVFAICCGPNIIVMVIVGIIAFQKQQKKKKAEARIWASAEAGSPTYSTMAPASQMTNAPVITPPIEQPRTLAPPPGPDPAQGQRNEEMKALDDFMASIGTEGSSDERGGSGGSDPGSSSSGDVDR
jgi:hypothetical protein